MPVARSPKFLTCKAEICAYMGNISDYIFKKYVRVGLPARYEDGRWCASTDNIDEWWRVYTRVSLKNVIDSIPDNGDEGIRDMRP